MAIILATAPAPVGTEPEPQEPPAATDAELLTPPPALAWPDGLPGSWRVLGDVWFLGELTLPAGELLPEALADHITQRLKYLDDYPGLCAVKLTGLAAVKDAKRKQDVDDCNAAAVVLVTGATADGFDHWDMVIGSSIAAGVGIIVGIVLGIAAGL